MTTFTRLLKGADRRMAPNAVLCSTIDAAVAIKASQDFVRWTRSELRHVLPHESSLCGIGKWDERGVKMSNAVAYNFPRGYLRELRTAEGRLQTFFLSRWFRQQKPQLYQPKAKVADLPCRTNVNDYGLRNLILHGVLDGESNRATFFTFFRIRGELASVHARLVKLLAPHMQSALARALDSDTVDCAHCKGLSQRECEILRLIASGRSDGQIADELVLSPKTVGHHVTSILAKLKANNRAHAVAIGIGQQCVAPIRPRPRSVLENMNPCSARASCSTSSQLQKKSRTKF